MRLRLRCLYTPRLAGRADKAKGEVFPVRIHAFGTHELRRERVSTAAYFGPELVDERQTPRAEAASEFEFRVVIDWVGVRAIDDVYAPLRRLGAYTFDEVGRRFEPHKISRSAHVVFNAYAQTSTPERQVCWTRVGSTSFTLDEIRDALRGAVLRSALVQNAADVVPNKQHPDVLRTDPPVIKGEIALLEAELDGGSMVDFENSLLPPQTTFDLDTTERKRAAAVEMSAVIDRDMATFFGPTAVLPTPSIAPLQKFHAVVSLKDQLVAPAIGYCLNRALQPPPFVFFERCIETVCDRRNTPVAQLNAIADALFDSTRPLPRQAERAALYSFCVAILALLANSLVYLDDFVNRNVSTGEWIDALVEGDEDHKIARSELADDCEGLALELLMLAVNVTHDLDGVMATAPRADGAKVQLLRNVARVLRHYVPCMKLGAATNVKLAYGATASMTSANTLGHTYTCFVPFARFDAMLTAEARAQLATTRAYQRYAADSAAAERLELPVLVGEATAIAEATMAPIDLHYRDDPQSLPIAVRVCETRTRAGSQLHAALDGTRWQLEMTVTGRYDEANVRSNRCDVSGFYKWSNGLSTPTFADSRLLDFALFYEHASDRSKTYGVTFNDFLLGAPANAGRSIGLLPTVRFSAREAAVIDNILALDEVVPRVVDAPGRPAVEPRLAALAMPQRRPPTPGTPIHYNTIFVTARVEDVGDAEVAALTAALAQIDAASVRVETRRLGAVDVVHLDPIDIVDVIITL